MSQTRIPPPRNAARTSCGCCEGGSGQKAEGDVTVHVVGLTVAKEMHGISFTRTHKRALCDPSMPTPRSLPTSPAATQSRSP